jgi:xanthine/uracil permease
VVGGVLVYILCAQISSGITLLKEAPGGLDFETGLLIGLAILLGTITAFLPAEVLASFPTMLRPVLGNGFVVGVLAALMMEHLVFRKK